MGAGAALAQPLPYHADPDAREVLPSCERGAGHTVSHHRRIPALQLPRRQRGTHRLNIDLARRICSEVNVAVYHPGLALGPGGQCPCRPPGDALIAGLAMTEETGARFDFLPDLSGPAGRFVTRVSDIEGFRLDKLRGKTVAVRAGSAHAAFMSRYLPEVEQRAFPTSWPPWMRSRPGPSRPFSAMPCARLLDQRQPGLLRLCRRPLFPSRTVREGLAVAVPAGQDSVRHAIDWALIRLKENGALDELYLRWFPIGFY